MNQAYGSRKTSITVSPMFVFKAKDMAIMLSSLITRFIIWNTIYIQI